MSLANTHISNLRSAVFDVHARGGIKLESTGTLAKDVLTNEACKNLRVGQGVQIGGETFTVLEVSADGKSAKLDKATETSSSGTAHEVYTDHNLLNLKTVDGKTVFAVDATGNPMLLNGRIPAVKNVLDVEAIRCGALVVSGPTDIVFTLNDNKPASIGKLGLPGSFHTVTVYNTGAADADLRYNSAPGVTSVVGKVLLGAAATVTIRIKTVGLRADGKEPDAFGDRFDVYVSPVAKAVSQSGILN